jgi:hypothetical protein
MFRASSVYPIQRLQQIRVYRMQAAQFGGGKSWRLQVASVSIKPISQPQGFGLRTHGFTPSALEMAAEISLLCASSGCPMIDRANFNASNSSGAAAMRRALA